MGGLGAGLVPPRGPELRRHSDVSPASLKELEKVRLVVLFFFIKQLFSDCSVKLLVLKTLNAL